MGFRRNQEPVLPQDNIPLLKEASNVTKGMKKASSAVESSETEWIIDGALSEADGATLHEAGRIVQYRGRRYAITQAKTEKIPFGNYLPSSQAHEPSRTDILRRRSPVPCQ